MSLQITKIFSYTKKNSEFIHVKIENQNFIIPKLISIYIFYNFAYPKFIDKKIKSEIFSIKANCIRKFGEIGI